MSEGGPYGRPNTVSARSTYASFVMEELFGTTQTGSGREGSCSDTSGGIPSEFVPYAEQNRPEVDISTYASASEIENELPSKYGC